jgi:hypothetical protein
MPRIDRTDARQGETRRGVRYVLIVSTTLAVLALLAVGLAIGA